MGVGEFRGNKTKSGWSLERRYQVKTFLVIAVWLTAISAIAGTEEKSFHAPRWHVGDKWTVRGWYGLVRQDPTNRMEIIEIRKGKPYEVTCDVSRIIPVETQACFEVTAKKSKMADEVQIDEKWVAYYTTNDLTLIKLVSGIRDDPSSHITYQFKNVRGSPTTTEDIPSFIPFDTPSFIVGTNLEGRDRFGHTCKQETVAEDGEPGHYILKLRTKHEENEHAPKERVMVQEWNVGLPWWRSCVLMHDGAIVQRWELILPDTPTNNVNETWVAPVIVQENNLPVIKPSGVRTNLVYPNGAVIVPGLSYPCRDCLYPVPVDYTGLCPWCKAPCRVVRAAYKAVVEPHGINQPSDRLRLFDSADKCIATFEAETNKITATNPFFGSWECTFTNTLNVLSDCSTLQFETNGVVLFQREMIRQERGTINKVKVQFIQGTYTPNEALLECNLTMWRPLELRVNFSELK